MHQIVYTSSAKQEFSVSDLKKLLAGARRRNNSVGVTGMLIFHDGTFLQALEGEHRAVNEIFASIGNDPRHGPLTVLHRGPGPEQRVFGESSMGFADFSGAAAILKGFVSVNDNLNLKDLDRTRAVELLTACEDDDLLKSA
jgi:Sensors of blue-light using FAD